MRSAPYVILEVPVIRQGLVWIRVGHRYDPEKFNNEHFRPLREAVWARFCAVCDGLPIHTGRPRELCLMPAPEGYKD